MEIELDEVKSIHETTLTIRGSRRRTTVPSEIVEFMKLENRDKIRWVALKNGTIFVTKTK